MNDFVLPLSTFKKIADTTPVINTRTLPERNQRLTRFTVRKDKDGPLYSPAIWDAGCTRGNAGIKELTAVVLDCEKTAPPFAEVKPRLEGKASIWHTTHRHTSENERYRIILPLSRPVSPEKWPSVHRGAVRSLGLDGRIDPTCAEPARAYYAASCSPENEADSFSGFTEGDLWNPDELMELVADEPSPAEFTEDAIASKKSVGGRPGDDFNQRATWEEILSTHGWRRVSESRGVAKWVKPGDPGNEHQATTNNAGSDLFYCFSPDAPPMPCAKALSKFAVYALLNHNDDYSAAAKDLASKGYGDPILTPCPTAENPAEGEQRRITVVEAFAFMKMEFPPRENILSPWLPRQGLTMVYAPRGIGKTHFSLGVSYAVSSGGQFFSWRAPFPRGVLFLDGEMPAGVLQERLARIAVSSAGEPEAPLRIVTPDLQPSGMIDLTKPEDQRALTPYLEGVDLIVVDNLSTLCRRGKENEGEAWLPVQEWALGQRAAGRSILFIHHAGKNGEQRGTSRREDVLDTVIALKRPGDYTPDKGACFEVHFEKARGIFGDDTKPFEAQLVTGPDEHQEWLTKPLDQSTAEKVAALLNEGISQIEIAELLGVTKGAVSKARKRAADSGLLKVA